MRKVLSAAAMQAADIHTIESHHMPAAVLMERAAAACVFEIEEHFDNRMKVGVLCGVGNNGGDGVAIARLLYRDGYDVRVLMLGDVDKYNITLLLQIEIAKSYNIQFVGDIRELDGCGLLIDAIFGLGLKREVTGEFADAISYVNRRHAIEDPTDPLSAKVLSVDIPSGISSDNGQILGQAVVADRTVTFGYKKKGHCLGAGYLNSGKVFVADIGIYVNKQSREEAMLDTCGLELEDTDLDLIPRRQRSANKSAAKVLVIAGSESIYGACYLSAKAAYKAGAGYVKVYTHRDNLPTLNAALPEAVCIGYDDPDEAYLKDLISWADAVLVGPGISKGAGAAKIVHVVLENSGKPMIVDADALNIIAENMGSGASFKASDMLKAAKAPVVITPHLLEMSRLTGQNVTDIQGSMEESARAFTKEYGCSVLLKSYTSVITGEVRAASGDGIVDTLFFNTSGSEALATAGSGDVLAGIAAAYLAMGVEPTLAAALAAYIHGKAGVEASAQAAHGVIMASDIINVM